MRSHRKLIAAAAVPLALLIGGCTAPAVADPPATASVPGPEAQSGSEAALALLDTLEIKGRAPKTGYSRDKFGQAWSDDVSVEMGHDGCDTRIICTRHSQSGLIGQADRRFWRRARQRLSEARL